VTDTISLKRLIGLGAKVTTQEGDGIVVGIRRTDPLRFDIRLLASGRVLPDKPGPEVTLIDDHPVNDPTIPQAYRDWLKVYREHKNPPLTATQGTEHI
jgi:hypothetical protein